MRRLSIFLDNSSVRRSPARQSAARRSPLIFLERGLESNRGCAAKEEIYSLNI
jgi:hypothetical protein